MNWLDSDAVATASAVRAGQVLPTELVEQTITAITAINTELNAYTYVDAEGAREQAQRSLRRLRRGDDAPLLGVPVSIKDAVWVAGLPATNGSRAYEYFVPNEDAVLVGRLREAGAVIVGKTNNPEFLYRTFTDNLLFGPTRNPWDTTRTAGGSSGGSAAAVAAGLGALSIGSDSGGSLRVPASFCNVVAHKPTFGIVPSLPGFRGMPSLSSAGPIARSVRDVALLMDVISGVDIRRANSLSVRLEKARLPSRESMAGLRVAYSVDLGQTLVDDEVRCIFLDAVSRFASLGLLPVERHPACPPVFDVWGRIAAVESFASEGALLELWGDRMTSGTRDLIEAGRGISAADYRAAQHTRWVMQRDWESFLTQYDVILTPIAEVPAYLLEEGPPSHINGVPCGNPAFEEWTKLALVANLTRQPALAVPIGFTETGLPVGMQIMARRFRDDICLELGAIWEAHTRLGELSPPISVRVHYG